MASDELAPESVSRQLIELSQSAPPVHSFNRQLLRIVIDSVGAMAATLWLVAALAGSSGAVIKGLAGRERPSHLDQPVGQERIVFHGPAQGLRHAPYQSFPSGHTLGAFATATSLAAFYPQARAVFYAVAAASGVNRVVKHQHFLSDVIAGAVLGHVLAAWLLRLPRIRQRVSAQPGRPSQVPLRAPGGCVLRRQGSHRALPGLPRFCARGGRPVRQAARSNDQRTDQLCHPLLP